MEEEFNQTEEEIEEKEINVMEFGLDESQINELIEKLHELRDNSEGHTHFTIDEDNDLLIHFEESDDGVEGEEENE